jgi:hypothetical protein
MSSSALLLSAAGQTRGREKETQSCANRMYLVQTASRIESEERQPAAETAGAKQLAARSVCKSAAAEESVVANE